MAKTCESCETCEFDCSRSPPASGVASPRDCPTGEAPKVRRPQLDMHFAQP